MSHIHWTYFAALEQDLERTARYVEFCPDNYGVYSVEFARLLIASASEIDVVAKMIRANVTGIAPAKESHPAYMPPVLAAIPCLQTNGVILPQCGISLKPWAGWTANPAPVWWTAYNNVKHSRNIHFKKANLENVLFAMGSLLLLLHAYYALTLPAFVTGSLPLPQRLPHMPNELHPRPVFLQSQYFG